MTDKITKDKTWLNFARVMIEVELSNEVLEEIHFINEYGQLVSQSIEYNWMPVKCSYCKTIDTRGLIVRRRRMRFGLLRYLIRLQLPKLEMSSLPLKRWMWPTII